MKSGEPEKKQNSGLTGFHYGIAGAATGTITRFLVQPLDVLKITFQLQITPKKSKEKAKYVSIFQALRTIVKEEGVPGLWKGHIPAQFLSITFGAVQFSTYEVVTSYFHNVHPLYYTSSEHFINIGSGCVAGLAATVISFPFDIIKTHLVYQGEPKVYKGTLDVMTKMYRREGPRGFFKGLNAACIQTVPMSGFIFCFHGLFTQLWFFLFQNSHNTFRISTAGNITTGLLAGLCAKTIVYPFDLMKKRLQIQGFETDNQKSRQMFQCKRIVECFWLTVRHEGIFGLFKGFVPTLIKSGATASLYFTIYDEVCRLLRYSLGKS